MVGKDVSKSCTRKGVKVVAASQCDSPWDLTSNRISQDKPFANTQQQALAFPLPPKTPARDGRFFNSDLPGRRQQKEKGNMTIFPLPASSAA